MGTPSGLIDSESIVPMTDNTKQRLAKNTLFLYARMLFSMAVSLYTSRVVLNALGVSDYGIYNVVGGVLALFGFFNSSMSVASQRFLSFDLGTKNQAQLNKTFNVTLNIHIGIALLVFIVAETAGLWLVKDQLDLPADRMEAALFVYHFSIVSSMISITQTPFSALIIAHERMNIFAVVSIAEASLKLVAVYLLQLSPFDKLKTYSVLLLLITLFISTVYKLYCVKKLDESKFRLVLDKTLHRRILSFSGWNLFGNIAGVAKGQGTNVLLNIFFGTILNAAYGIMMQVQNAVNLFVNNFQMAVNPLITKSYATGDLVGMKKLVFHSAKICYFVVFMLICPIIYSVDFILGWWLNQSVPYAAGFTTLTLINLLIESISRPLITAAMATGNIKLYQIVLGSILFLNLPLSYLAFKWFSLPTLFLHIAIALSLVILGLRLLFLVKLIHLDLLKFAKQVFIPIAGVSALSVGVMYVIRTAGFTADSFIEFISISALLCTVNTASILLLGLKKSERTMIWNLLNQKIKKKQALNITH